MLENAQNFKKDGFLISKPIVAENEIKSVRLELDNEFCNLIGVRVPH